MINVDEIRKLFIASIITDRKVLRNTKVRYEILRQGDHRLINCIDENVFASHTNDFNIQGLTEYQRRSVQIGSIPAEMVIMRHSDNTKNFEQHDGLIVGYMKAMCELVYFEVTF